MVSDIHLDMITKVHIAVIPNPLDWWFDSSATMLMCNNKKQFKIYEKSFIEQEVLMGNHNKAKVHGKCTIEMKMSSNKKVELD